MSSSSRPRFRRWLLRLVLWSLAVLAFVLFAAAVSVRSEAVRALLHRELVDRLEARFERPVTLADAEFSLLPPVLELEGLEIGPSAPGTPPLFTVDRLRLEGAVLNPWRRAWRLRQVEAVRPRLYLATDDEGRLDLTGFGGRGGGGLRIGALLVEDGIFGFEHGEWPLALEARDVRARLVGEGPGRLHGQATAGAVDLRLPGAEALPLEVTLNGRTGPGEVEIEEARLSAPDLSLIARGAVRWGDEVEAERGERYRIELAGTARGESAVLTRLGYLDGELDGALRVEGIFRAADGDWEFEGGVSSPRLVWMGRTVDDVAGVLTADDDAVRLAIERGGYVGGTLSGWILAELDAPAYPVEVDLAFDSLVLDRLLASEGVALDGFASVADGDLNYRSVRQARSSGAGWGRFEVRRVAGPGVPLAGEVPLTIDAGVISSQAVLLEAAAQRLFFGGAYDLETRRGSFDFEARSEDLEQLARLLLPYLGGDLDAAWVPRAGRGVIEGTLALAAGESPGLAARLDLDAVTTSEVSAESVRGGLQVEDGALAHLSVELAEGDAALLVTGSVRPRSRRDTGPPRRAEIELDFDALDWPLETIAAWRELAVPLAGPVTGRLTLVGDGDALAGRAQAAVSPAELAGRPVDAVRGEVAWDSESLDVRRLVVAAPAGEAEVRGSWALASGALDFIAEADLALDAAPLSEWIGGELGGRARLDATLGGTLEAPLAEVEARLSELSVMGRALAGGGEGEPSAALTASWDGERLRAEGELLALLAFEGGGALDREEADLSFELASSELRSLVELASAHRLPELDGELAGRLLVAGPVGRPDQLEIDLVLDRLTASYAGVEIEQLEPVQASYRDGVVVLRSLFLGDAEQTSELFAAGRIELDGGLDLRLQSSLATARLAPALEQLGVDPELVLPGRLELLGRLAGDVRSPFLDGQGRLTLAPFVLPNVPQPVEGLSAQFAFYPDRAELESVEARIGDGSLRGRGTVERASDGGLGAYRLYASLDDVKVLFPDGWLQQGDAELWLSAEPGRERELQGLVELAQARYLEDLDVGLGTTLQRLLEPERQEVGSTDEWLAGTRLDVLIEAPRALRVRNRAANLRGDLDLELRGTLARPVLLGTVDLAPGGTLVYAGNEYRLERGLVTFANLYRTEPLVDLVATSRLRNYEVTLNLSGTPERLDFEVGSDPPLPELDLMALVAGGAPVDRNARPALPGSADEGQIDAQAFLYGQAASAITDRVNVLFGLDKLRVDPLPKSTGGSSVRLTVGKRLSSDLFITYSRDPSTTEEDILEAEWQISSNLVLVFTQNGDGSFSVDALWDRRF